MGAPRVTVPLACTVTDAVSFSTPPLKTQSPGTIVSAAGLGPLYISSSSDEEGT